MQMGKISKQTFVVEVATDKETFEGWLEEKIQEIYCTAVDDFKEKAIEAFARFNALHGYPSVADCDDILNDVATDIKECDADGTS